MTLSAHPLRRALLLALAVAGTYALVASFAVPARALDDTKPTPTCAGMDFTDPKGDAAIDFVGLGIGAMSAPDNLDITGGFFKYDADSTGTASLTANIQVSNLSKEIPTAADASSWTFRWTVAGTVYYLLAEVGSDGTPTFEYGTVDGVQLTKAGNTKGKFFEGVDGVIQIAVPQAGTKATDGAKLTTPYTTASATYGPGPSLLITADNGPDSQAGKTYEVAQCPSIATPSTSTPGTGTETTPGTSSGVLPVTLLTSSARASKAKKGKSLSFKLKSTEEITGVTAKLKKGSTFYGTANLAKVNGSATLKMKLKKALKKGTYKLNLTGSTAAGKGKATFSIKVK
jgi:hypothetical protein